MFNESSAIILWTIKYENGSSRPVDRKGALRMIVGLALRSNRIIESFEL